MITAKPKVFSPATQINFSAAPHFIYLESRIASCSSLRGEGDLPLFPAWLMLRINYKPRFLRPRRSTLRPLRDAAAQFVSLVGADSGRVRAVIIRLATY